MKACGENNASKVLFIGHVTYIPYMLAAWVFIVTVLLLLLLLLCLILMGYMYFLSPPDNLGLAF
jgi:hypothetical protein